MTDPSDPLAALVDAVLEQAEEIATLDAARAEAWGSDVLALVSEAGLEPSALFDALVARDTDLAAVTLAALAGVADGVPTASWIGPRPGWVEAIGTSRCEGAWTLRDGDAESLVFRFVDALDHRHVLTVDLSAGPAETVGEVLVGPGDLLDALEEDDSGLDSEAGEPPLLARRCVDALRATTRPSLSAVVNGRLLLRRLAELTIVDIAPPVPADEEIPVLPERDPDDDAYALDVLERALAPAASDHPAVADVAGRVAPIDMASLSPSERDAVLILEWADWLGAVIGLVRAGPGCAVDGPGMVDMVNRCPEVTTTIPKSDRARIEWAFETLIAGWRELGLVDDDGLTELAVDVLPAALRMAWT